MDSSPETSHDQTLLEHTALFTLNESLRWVRPKWLAGDWQPGRRVLTTSGLMRLAVQLTSAYFYSALVYNAVKAGVGLRPLGSVDSIWIVTVRPWIADHEIGWILAAADQVDESGVRTGLKRDPSSVNRVIAEALQMTRPVDLATTEAQRAIAEFLHAAGARAEEVASLGKVAEGVGGGRERARQTQRAIFSKALTSETIARTVDAYARVAVLRWQKLKQRGHKSTRT